MAIRRVRARDEALRAVQSAAKRSARRIKTSTVSRNLALLGGEYSQARDFKLFSYCLGGRSYIRRALCPCGSALAFPTRQACTRHFETSCGLRDQPSIKEYFDSNLMCGARVVAGCIGQGGDRGTVEVAVGVILFFRLCGHPESACRMVFYVIIHVNTFLIKKEKKLPKRHPTASKITTFPEKNGILARTPGPGVTPGLPESGSPGLPDCPRLPATAK